MKMKKFIAPTTAAALAHVKTEFGDRAVVLSTRSTAKGVEILASVEDELAGLIDAARSIEPQVVAEPRAAAAQPAPALTPEYFSGAERTAAPRESKMFSFAEWLRRRGDSAHAQPKPAANAPTERRVDHVIGELGAPARQPEPAVVPKVIVREIVAPAAPIAPAPAAPSAALAAPPGAAARTAPSAPTVVPSVPPIAAIAPPATPERISAAEQAAIMDELRALRGLVEHHLQARPAAPGTTDATNASSLAAELLPQLLAAGFSTVLARTLSNACPNDRDLSQARAWLQAHIADAIPFADSRNEIVERGGAYALTGPTGVGKTTTAAKIAARCVVKYGAQSLGLVTTDTYRIGAPDQLRIYGKILGVPVHTVQDASALRQALDSLRTKRVVLIDTVGLAQRDDRVQELLNLLDEAGVARLLLLAATSQLATLDDVVHAYRGQTAIGTIVTKVDEAAQLGSVVDILMRRKLALHYLATGQRVPEDLQIPDREALVARSLRVPVSTLYVPTSEEAIAVTAAIGRWSGRTGPAGTVAHA